MGRGNTLFNEATTKKLISGIRLSMRQKKSAEEWIRLMENKELLKEKQGYLKFYDIILKEILGYENIQHEKEGVEFSYEKNNKSIVRIEAKGMDTKDLFLPQKRAKEESPVQQLWRYMQKYATPYGIVTNYKTFILFKYDVGSSKYYSFDFEEIKENPNKLAEFVAIFSKSSMDEGFIEDLYEKSIIEEREFTKEFYKLYHETRLMLIKEFEENQTERDVSVHFAQIFLNRLMFVFFAEDTDKLEKRIIEDKILKMLERNKDIFSNQSKFISDLIVTLFNELNEGNPPKIFGFNGGLFKNPIPPRIHFKDFRDNKFFSDVQQFSKLKNNNLDLNKREIEVFEAYENKLNPIIKNILLMASFDFNSEVNVNILGHIFEQSISDIETLKSNSITRRKKEGIFYTPEYITDYICRNTIIPFLSKNESNNIPDLIKEYADNIEELETKFRNLKILDPACGSGAFLIKATDIMLEIFKSIQEFKQSEGKYEAFELGKGKLGKRKLKNTKGILNLKKWSEEAEIREIIENNIFGVDMNEESIEITKLSLFLKMARKNRKLSDLSNNIKQGNSLVDDENIAGKLAFNWDKEFPFKFDVIIGNPPYVKRQNLENKNEVDYFEEKYSSATYNFDLYMLFTEKGFLLLQEKGRLGYILPSKFTSTKTGEGLRTFIEENATIYEFVNFKEHQIFDDATTYTCLLFLTDNKKHVTKYLEINPKKPVDIFSYNSSEISIDRSSSDIGWSISSTKSIKLKNTGLSIDDIGSIFTGIETGSDPIFIIHKNNPNYRLFLKYEGSIVHKVLKGGCVDRYISDADEYIVIVPYDRNNKLISESELQKYPEIYNYLMSNKKLLQSRENGKMNGRNWYGYVYPKNLYKYQSPRIIWPDIAILPEFAFDRTETWHVRTVCSLVILNNEIDYRYLLGLLNSEVFHYFVKENSNSIRGGYLRYRPQYIRKFPVVINANLSKPLIELVSKQTKFSTDLQQKMKPFLNRIISNLKLESLSKKLQNFYTLDWTEFLEELKRNKITLSLKDQDEWEKYFDEYKKDVSHLKKEIVNCDREINNLVYKIYDITPEEQKIIEESLK